MSLKDKKFTANKVNKTDRCAPANISVIYSHIRSVMLTSNNLPLLSLCRCYTVKAILNWALSSITYRSEPINPLTSKFKFPIVPLIQQRGVLSDLFPQRQFVFSGQAAV